MVKLAKKISFLITFILVFLTTGFGCKGLSQTEEAATKPVTLTYWTVFGDGPALQAQVEKYRAQGHPYLKVNFVKVSEADIYSRLIEALAEDRAPDIISLSNRSLGAFQSKLAAMPLSVPDTLLVVEQGRLGTNTTVIKRTVPLVTLDQLDREYVQAARKDVVRGGSIYGLPLSLDTMAIFYNKDLLDRSGVPEPPKTWEEFQAAVRKISRYDKATGRILQSGAALGTGNNIPGADDLLSIFFRQSGVDMVDRSGRAVFSLAAENLDRDTVTPAMSVVNFYTDFANPTRDTYSWNEQQNDALESFVSGRVGFFFGYSYHLPLVQARASQLNFGVMPLLQLNPDQPVNVANYWVETVVAKSTHKDEAWALINWLAHSAATKEYLDATGRPTALRTYIAEQQQKKELEPFVGQLLVAENWYRGNNYPAALRALRDMTRDWLTEPPDPRDLNLWRQEILTRAADRINQTL